MNSSVVIRKADKNDLERIMAVEKGSFEHGWTRGMIEEELERDDSSVFIAENENAAIGCSIVRSTDDFAELFRIAVIPSMREIGIGSKLLDAAIDWSRDRKKLRLLLEVREDNLSACALYRRAGFIVNGVRKKYYEGKINAVLMELSL